MENEIVKKDSMLALTDKDGGIIGFWHLCPTKREWILYKTERAGPDEIQSLIKEAVVTFKTIKE